MKTQYIGSFEAKTKLPELLRQAEKGGVFVITNRGRPVAKLSACDDSPAAVDVRDLVDTIKAFRPAADCSNLITSELREAGRR